MCLQTKKGKRAKSMTAAEWLEFLKTTIKKTRNLWQQVYPNRPFSECTFVFDNPNFHTLTEAQLNELLAPGLLDTLAQLVKVSVYSGDLMQLIECTHGTVCQEWARMRFRNGSSFEANDMEEDVQAIFKRVVTAKSLKAHVKKLMKCLNHVAHISKGDYATPELV